MQLPRRVPWASVGELEQVCTWIYADDNDIDAKVAALNRLSAWRFITSLPHALDATLSLLAVVVQDDRGPMSQNSVSLRQSYSLALVRLVNGLVDPLQTGVYARSIASIAAQIGLPSWLVELRHAATHEELPSLELLRDGAKESMVWLLHNYFLPTLSSSTVDPRPAHLSPLAPLLKDYKGLLKITTRDASLRAQHQPQIDRLMRDIERWVGEAMVAAWGSSLIDFSGDNEGRERWALERMCDSLIEVNALVPLSKRKRLPTEPSMLPPNAQLWAPLLDQLRLHHPSFPSTLLSHIMNQLLSYPSDDESYDVSLSAWVLWIVEKWGDSPDCGREDIVASLIVGLGKEEAIPSRPVKNLIQQLSSEDPRLERRIRLLVTILDSKGGEPWNVGNVELMEKRLATIKAHFQSPATPSTAKLAIPDVDSSAYVAPGWRLLDAGTGWQPCPIGS